MLIAANISVEAPKQAEIIKVNTTQQMYEAVISKMEKADIIIKAAAPADYRVKQKSSQKIKAETLSLELEKNADIAAEAGKEGRQKNLWFLPPNPKIYCATPRKSSRRKTPT